MAITTAICNSYKQEVLEGVHTSTDTYKLALYTSTATLGASTTAYSSTNEVANVTGEHMHTSIGAVVASGGGLTDQVTGVEATSYVATVTANVTEDPVQNAVANVTTVQATASAGSVTASAGTVVEEKPAGGRSRRKTISAPKFLHSKDGKARIIGVDAFATAGGVFAIGVVNARASVKPARVKSAVAKPSARGIQNPTDEQLLMLLLA